jgi:hypothetical protein
MDNITKKAPLITIDEAVARSKAAGFPNMTRRWWERNVERGAIQFFPGVVDYLSSADVDLMIETVRAAGDDE